MSLAMKRTEREAFLAETRVGVLSVADPARSPLTVPVWYEYEPGAEVRIVTGGGSRKVGLIRAAGRMALCVQDEAPPYRYVTVEGPVTVEEASHDERLDLARRYLGLEGGDAYVAAVPTGGQVVFRMTPKRWLTVDYSKVYP